VFIKLETAGTKVLCTPINIELTCGPISFDLSNTEQAFFTVHGTQNQGLQTFDFSDIPVTRIND